MEQMALKAGVRTEKGSGACRRLRSKGWVPGVLYGRKQDCVSLAVKHEEIDRVLRAGSRMLTLEVGEQSERVLLKEVQYSHLGDEVIHVDFARVALDEQIEVEVPVVLKGTAAGVTEGGTLEQILHEVTVSCLPAQIPEALTVRVSELGIGDVLRLSDIELPEGAKVIGDDEAAVVTVHPPAPEEEEEEAAAEEAEGDEPKVIGRKEEAAEGEEPQKE